MPLYLVSHFGVAFRDIVAHRNLPRKIMTVSGHDGGAVGSLSLFIESQVVRKSEGLQYLEVRLNGSIHSMEQSLLFISDR